MENNQVHYEIFIFALNKMFKTMNIRFILTHRGSGHTSL